MKTLKNFKEFSKINEGEDMDALYEEGAFIINKGADLLAPQSGLFNQDDQDRWDNYSNMDPDEMIGELEKAGTPEAQKIIDELKGIQQEMNDTEGGESCPDCSGFGCPACGDTGFITEGNELAGIFNPEHKDTIIWPKTISREDIDRYERGLATMFDLDDLDERMDICGGILSDIELEYPDEYDEIEDEIRELTLL